MNKSSAANAEALKKILKVQFKYPSNAKLDHNDLVALLAALHSNSQLSKRELDAIPLIFKTYGIYHALICLLAQKMARHGKQNQGEDHVRAMAIQVLIKTTIEGIQALENLPPKLLIPYSELMNLFPINVPANPSKKKAALKLLTKLRVGSCMEDSSDTSISRVKNDRFSQVAERILDSIRDDADPSKLDNDEIRRWTSVEIKKLDKDTFDELANAAAAKSDKGKPGRMKARLIDTVAQRMLSLLGRNTNR